MDQPTEQTEQTDIIDLMSEVYKAAYKKHGAHSPMAVDVRAFIVRYFQHAGNQRVIQLNRDLNTTGQQNIDPETGDSTLQAFVHPKAAKKNLPVSPQQVQPAEKQKTQTTQTPHKNTNHVAADIPPSEPGKVGDVVGLPLDEKELAELKGMKASEITARFPLPRLIATAQQLKIKDVEGAKRPAQVAAMIKSHLDQ